MKYGRVSQDAPVIMAPGDVNQPISGLAFEGGVVTITRHDKVADAVCAVTRGGAGDDE